MAGINLQYKNFAYYYDSLMDDFDYASWSGYIAQILKSHGVEYTDLLDMACGTGSMAVEMAKKGYAVTAFDLSDDMLSVARYKSDENCTSIRFIHQDMNDIKINDSFGIVTCLCDSMNYITDENSIRRLFKWVYAHLKPNGVFIFDMNSPYKLRTIIGNNTFTRNDDDIAYIWDNYLDDDGIVEFYLSFFVRQGELYRRFDEVHREKIYEIPQITEYLRKAGFSTIDMFDAFTFDAPFKESERINFAAAR